jgi:hypothetical protein
VTGLAFLLILVICALWMAPHGFGRWLRKVRDGYNGVTEERKGKV